MNVNLILKRNISFVKNLEKGDHNLIHHNLSLLAFHAEKNSTNFKLITIFFIEADSLIKNFHEPIKLLVKNMGMLEELISAKEPRKGGATNAHFNM
jgi:hypothetical protein